MNNCIMQIQRTKGKGRAVFVTRLFKQGEFVCEYSGELLTYQQAKEREKYQKRQSVGSFMYYFTHKGKKIW